MSTIATNSARCGTNFVGQGGNLTCPFQVTLNLYAKEHNFFFRMDDVPFNLHLIRQITKTDDFCFSNI